MSRQMPKAGEFYKHFKGNLYQIVAVARDADSTESRVVYQALYDTFQIYDRRLEDFLSPVDKVKYPDADQEYRFEQVVFEKDTKSRAIVPVKTTITRLRDESEYTAVNGEQYAAIENQRKELEAQPRLHLENRVKGAIESHTPGVDSRLIAFLDAETYTEKLEIYNHMREDITEKILSDITAALDISPSDGTLDEQYESVRRDLLTLAKFERNKK